MKKVFALVLAILATGSIARADQPPLMAAPRANMLGSYIFQPLPVGLFTWQSTDSAPGLLQSAQTSDVAPSNLTITSSAPYASASTNLIPGNVQLVIPAPVGAGANGFTQIKIAGTLALSLGNQVGQSNPGIYLGSSAPAAGTYAMVSDGSALYLNAISSTIHIRAANAADFASFASGAITLAQPTSLSSTLAVTGNATLSAGQIVKQVTKTGNYTVDGTPSDFIVFTDSTSNTVQITCPAPAAGRCFYVKDKTGKVTTHAVTVTHNAAETIDGAATITMTKNFDSVYLCSDGTNWAVMSEYSTTIVP